MSILDAETTCAWLRALAASNAGLANLAKMIESGSVTDPAGMAAWLRSLATANAWCSTLADMTYSESVMAQEVIDASRAALASLPPGADRDRLAAALAAIDATIN